MGWQVSITPGLSSCPPYPVSTLRMEVVHYSESSVFIYQSVWYHIPEGSYYILCGKKVWYTEEEHCTLSWSANSVLNLLAPELNFQCNLQKPQFKLQDLFFLAQTYKTKQKEETPTGLYQNGHYWLTHTFCHLGIVSCTLWCIVCPAKTYQPLNTLHTLI